MGKQMCSKRKKDASEAQEPCHSVGGLFEPMQPYCFPPAERRDAGSRASGSVGISTRQLAGMNTNVEKRSRCQDGCGRMNCGATTRELSVWAPSRMMFDYHCTLHNGSELELRIASYHEAGDIEDWRKGEMGIQIVAMGERVSQGGGTIPVLSNVDMKSYSGTKRLKKRKR